ncbi:MAG: hypothetical protein IT204_19885 [Fimbriimonadaceae bacterium]|nr:hypothetical protein [Fimbriimonadaceae bacterium]
MDDRVGEVLSSSTVACTAQAPASELAPDLGAFVVTVSPPEALGVVTAVRVAGFDSHRRPLAYGLPPDELERQQPQLRELLVTEFDLVLLGACELDGWRQRLPARPPRLHSFVRLATAAEVRTITAQPDWLRTLAAAEPRDDVLAAAIRAAAAARPGDRQHLVQTGRALARLWADDYERLQALLRRVQP